MPLVLRGEFDRAVGDQLTQEALIAAARTAGLEDARITLADGSPAGLTLHTLDGTIPQLRRSLDRSLDAFFDLLPGADDEDQKTFGE